MDVVAAVHGREVTNDLNVAEFEVFVDLDVLIAAFPDQGADDS